VGLELELLGGELEVHVVSVLTIDQSVNYPQKSIAQPDAGVQLSNGQYVAPPMRTRLIALALPALLAGCGGSLPAPGSRPVIGAGASTHAAARLLGFPDFATQNTTRVGGSDPTADAAGVAQAVYPGGARPQAVALVDSHDWQGGIAAAVLMSPPLRAPTLLTDSGSVPAATSDALAQLKPTGSTAAGGAAAIRIGAAAKPGGVQSTALRGKGPAAEAAAIDELQSVAAGKPSADVVVVSDSAPTYAMPAAGWAALSGDPVLFVNRTGVPAATAAALKAHQGAHIYVLGPASVVPDKVFSALGRFGKIARIAGPDPVSNAIAFARYRSGGFGWDITDPGHGLVFASAARPLDAAAAAPLSASGDYGPLLLMTGANVPGALRSYLLDIQPGYTTNPTRGVYSHGWLIGDHGAISLAAQAQIDSLLEIQPTK
jgi:hypothetical protein